MRFSRSSRPTVAVAPGERLLASAATPDGTVLAGTRDAFYLAVPGQEVRRTPWEEVEAARWDRDSDTFHLSEVGSWGQQRPSVEVHLEEPGRLLELVRERVTASVVLQRHVAVHGRRGLRVIARRAPSGERPVQWVYEYDEGIDPDDPEVRAAAEQALDAARLEVGLG
ncbi:MAG: hypothetical protein LT071_05620 [Nocardioides sp.]|nr:hypothetical protein [Nocardioides sp.]